MTNLNEIKVTVSENDRITGSEQWDSTLENLKSWELTEDEIYSITIGETVKCISPNGRRIIFITIKK
jgi:hypothetical protein